MLNRLPEHLARRPCGWAALAVAAVTVVLPTAALGLTRLQPVWFGDTLPVVPTVVQLYRHGTRDLSAYLVPPREGRWAFFPVEGDVPYCVRPGPGGVGRYSSYPAGMEVFAWPAVLLADARGWDIERDWPQILIERQTAAVVGGLCAGLFFLAALAYLPWAAMYLTLYRTPFGPSMAFLDEHRGRPWPTPTRCWCVPAAGCSSTSRGGGSPCSFSPSRCGPTRTDHCRRGGMRSAWRSPPVTSGWSGRGRTGGRHLRQPQGPARHVGLVGSWAYWWGGYCWGSRLAAEVVPILGLLAVRPVGWLLGRRWGWAVLAAVAVLGFALHAPYLYLGAGWWDLTVGVDQHPERLWDWRNPPFLHRDPG